MYDPSSPPRLRDLTWREFRELVPNRFDAVVLPVGTVEAHGGIPLGTDIIIPEYLALKLATRLPLVIAPTVNYGVTRTLLPYPGSHTVTSETFARYCSEILTDFGRMGFAKVVVVNGHGGNIEELKAAALAAYRDRGVFTVILHWWLMAPEAGFGIFDGVGYHGAAEETAGVLAADPALVRSEDLVGLRGMTRGEGVFYMPLPRPAVIKEEGRGMPVADAGKAREYMEKIAERCVDVCEAAFRGWRDELGR